MKNQYGFSFTKLVVIVLICGVLFNIFILEPEENSPVVSSEQAREIIQESYGSRGTDTSWPRMPADAAAKADKLLAKNYMFVLDASGSMGEGECTRQQTKMDEAKLAIMAFGESLGADANIGLLAFSSSAISVVLPLSPFDKNSLQASLHKVTFGGSTPLADAIDAGFASLNAQAVKQLGNGQYNLVVVTDGEADSGQDVLGSVDAVIKTSPVMIHAVGFCIGNQHALNQKGLTRYVAASDGETLRKGLQAVLAEAPAFDASAFQAVQ